MSHATGEKEPPLPDFIALDEGDSVWSEDNDDNEDDDHDIEITLTGDSTLIERGGSNSGGREKPRIPKHMRKSKPQIYDNISVFAPPDSALIFKCSLKKADWYLSRSLARRISPTSIHLNFVPAGPGRAGDAYYLEERENKCVICGETTEDAGATMMHVVPEQYRKWLPIRLKSHSSHDILVACPECNADWDRGATQLRKRIVQLYQVPLEGVGWIRDPDGGAAKRAAGAVVSEWKRQWEMQHLVPESAKKLDATREQDQEIGTLDQEEKKSKKKSKEKKTNILPPERLKFLEQQVLTWWTTQHQRQASEQDMEEEGDTGEIKKRDATSALEDDGTAETPRKRTKESKTVPPADQESVAGFPPVANKPEGIPLDEVPLPPPGHLTELSPAILHHALNIQPHYKGPDYKEHGQLVMARVMASSPEYHLDKNESPETLEMWTRATPIAPKEGWRNVTEFIQTWRKKFLEVTKPQHLSAEWKVDDPIDKPE